MRPIQNLKRKPSVWIAIALLYSSWLFAQDDLQNAQWRLFDSGGLDFMAASPPASISSNVGNDKDVAAVSDYRSGALLFYTDGNSVWDSSNSLMANGNGSLLSKSGSFSQNTVIVPNPADLNRYYIVTLSVDEGLGGTMHGLRVSEVDMSPGSEEVISATLNTPLSDADTTPVPIDGSYSIPFGKLATAIHSNGMDYWIIAEIGDEILAYLVNDIGIQQPPIVSPSPLSSLGGSLYTTTALDFPGSCNGGMKISPDSSRILMIHSKVDDATVISRLIIGYFNNATGEVHGNAIGGFTVIPTTAFADQEWLTGAEFSPNGNFVHAFYEGVGVVSEIADVSSTLTVTGQDVQFAIADGRSFQRAIDDNIYLGNYDLLNSNCGVVEDPDDSDITLGDFDYQYFNVDYGSATTQYTHFPPWVWMGCVRYLTSAENITSGTIEQERQYWIESTDVFDGSATKGIYHAGDYVELNPGFETKNSAGFSAYIEACTNDFNYRFASSPVAENIPPNTSARNPEGLQIYPNPSNNTIYLRLSEGQIKSVSIITIDGKEMQNFRVESTGEIDISNFANGMYLISIQTQSGKIISHKFIKN